MNCDARPLSWSTLAQVVSWMPTVENVSSGSRWKCVDSPSETVGVILGRTTPAVVRPISALWVPFSLVKALAARLNPAFPSKPAAARPAEVCQIARASPYGKETAIAAPGSHGYQSLCVWPSAQVNAPPLALCPGAVVCTCPGKDQTGLTQAVESGPTAESPGAGAMYWKC